MVALCCEQEQGLLQLPGQKQGYFFCVVCHLFLSPIQTELVLHAEMGNVFTTSGICICTHLEKNTAYLTLLLKGQ